jgi:hypothetical protein
MYQLKTKQSSYSRFNVEFMHKFNNQFECKFIQCGGIFLFMAILLMMPKIAISEDANLAPNKTYTPQQVITIVLDSMQKNAADDEGIATVFRFASPDNKAVTGPLSRFTKMIKLGYADMLNYKGVRYDDIEIEGDLALQAVWLQAPSGTEYRYAFKLSKQRGGEYDGMWMTDAVVLIGKNNGMAI